MNLDHIKYALNNILGKKLRTGLTVVSILIGITAIYALVSFGAGIENYVDEISEQAGVDKMFVQAKGIGAPGTDDSFVLTQDDVDFISKIPGVEEVAAVYFSAIEVKRDRQSKFVFGLGMDPKDAELAVNSFGTHIELGRELRNSDFEKIVIGYRYTQPDAIFEKPVIIGEKLEIDERKFEVVGAYEEIGNPQDDVSIYFSKRAYESLFPEKKDEFGFIILQASKGVPAAQLADRIQERLRKHKNQEKGKEDFFVQTFEDALQTFTAVILVLNGILVLIALISLVVATVNTMNTMYTAVVERTKEIGIMKAIGARNSDILFIFIFESGLMGMVGGILGVIVGYLIASAGGAAAAAGGYASLQPIFPLGLTIGCIVFSFTVGALAGVLPARQASKLKPVDALRYE